MSSPWSGGAIREFVDDFRTQAEDLCSIHDHVTRVVANLDIPVGRFADYDALGKATFDQGELIGISMLISHQGVAKLSQISV